MDTAEETLEARLARVRRQEYVKALRKREWIVLVFFLIFALVCFVDFKRVVVHGISMEPTFHSGETVIVWKGVLRNHLKPGDVIVFQLADGDELIKRIVYVGDSSKQAQFPPPGFPQVLSRPDGNYIAPGAPPEYTFERYFLSVRAGMKPPPPAANTIYIMGDNFFQSDDSRDFGPINPSQILGKVIP